MYDLNVVKSYATEANLNKALAKVTTGLPEWPSLLEVSHITCRNHSGRWVAVFPLGSLNARQIPMSAVIHNGFMVVN